MSDKFNAFVADTIRQLNPSDIPKDIQELLASKTSEAPNRVDNNNNINRNKDVSDTEVDSREHLKDLVSRVKPQEISELLSSSSSDTVVPQHNNNNINRESDDTVA